MYHPDMIIPPAMEALVVHESNQDEMYHPDGSGLVLFDPSNILNARIQVLSEPLGCGTHEI